MNAGTTERQGGSMCRWGRVGLGRRWIVGRCGVRYDVREYAYNVRAYSDAVSTVVVAISVDVCTRL